MEKNYKFLGFLFILILMGCSIFEPKERPKLAGSVESIEVLDAISKSFKENGFKIKELNTKYGRVITSWKEFESYSDMTSNVIEIAEVYLGEKSLTDHSRAIMLKAEITQEGYVIVMQIKKKEVTYGEDSGDNTEITNAEEGSEEGNFAESIASDINEKLGKNNLFKWGWTGLESDLR